MKVVNKLVKENDEERLITCGDVVIFEYSGGKGFGILTRINAGGLILISPNDNFNRWKDEQFSHCLTVNEFKKKIGQAYKSVEVIPCEKVMVTFELI